MKRHYEGQLTRMAEELASSKGAGGGIYEDAVPKKKVRFDHSKDIMFSPSPEAVEEATPPPKPPQQHMPTPSRYQSLFQGATNEFSSPIAVFSKSAVTQPIHQFSASSGGSPIVKPDTPRPEGETRRGTSRTTHSF